MRERLEVTESRNSASLHIDRKTTSEIVSIINKEDERVPKAVEAAHDEIVYVIDKVVECFKRGGRLFYIGAGTSGRLGVLDASECPPTYGVPATMVVGLIAGGRNALTNSIEGAEDDREAGIRDVKTQNLCENDTLIGITANGGAPYVMAALEYANSVGAFTAAISCNEDAKLFDLVEKGARIYLPVGPEIVTGSTRMKSGTAQKLTLNLITTVSMIKLGKVYNNLMVDLQPVNKKLIRRSINMIVTITGIEEAEAEKIFLLAGNNTKKAIVMAALEVDAQEAERLLSEESVISKLLMSHGAKRLSEDFR